jgi:succinate-semialdehyde dehydrogenase/glutarate-semialdehyde dehydrogenase
MIISINPATGAEISRHPTHSAAAIDAMLAGADQAQREWAATPLPERVATLRRLGDVLREAKHHYARIITAEMGKPIVEAEAEIEKCALTCDFYADNAERFLADEPVGSAALQSMVVFEPLGVVLAIMPWNYPFWQALRFAAPALAAGNGMILKHANNVAQCALAIEEAIRRAGAPEGLMRSVLVEPSEVAGLIRDDRIAAVTLTGSTQVGSIVAAQAGEVIKKQVLELGGSDPLIVLADADLEEAAQTAIKARFGNAGQSCISAKRIIVEEAIANRFVALFVAGVKALKVGDPMDRATQIGPLARANLRDALHDQVKRTLAEGGELLVGGHPVDGPGFAYAPTVIDRVTPDLVAFQEETFGPVAAIIRVKDEDEAIRLANQTEFGLGAAIWTRDLDKAYALSRRIAAGAVFVNAQVASDPRLPFGGIKQSGYGRELGSYGIREFTNIKTVWINSTRPTA